MLDAYRSNLALTAETLGGPDVTRLAANARVLDETTRRGRLAFGSYSRNLAAYQYVQPGRIWWGSFQFRTGFTTATILVNASAGGPTASVLFDGTQVASVATSTGTTTITIDLTGRGYTDNQIVEVDVRLAGGSVGQSYSVRDAYVGPVAAAMPAWVAAPTIGGTLSRASVQGIHTAARWLADALAMAREPVPMALKWYSGDGFAWPHTGATVPILAGSFHRAGSMQRFALAGYVQTYSVNQETIRLLIDGAVAASTVRTANSQAPLLLEADVSALSASTLHTWQLESLINTGITDGSGKVSYYSVHHALTYKHPDAPTGALPPARDSRQSVAYSTVKSDLNSIAGAINAARARWLAASDTFDRVRMFSRRFDVPNINGDERATYYGDRTVPQSWRRGPALWVRGKDVKLCYGPVTIARDDKGAWSYTHQYESQVIGGDAVETSLVYFDNLPGLPMGATYVLKGDVRGAFQVWR